MNTVLLLVRKDVKRRLRSPVAVLCMMLIPIVLTLIIGVVFGGSGEVEKLRVKVLLTDEENGLGGGFVRQSMQFGDLAEMVELIPVERDEGEAMMESGKASAHVIVPAGFTDSILDREPARISIVKNPSERFLPIIAEEIVKTDALIIDGASRVMEEPIRAARAMFERDRWPTGDELQSLLDSGRKRYALVEGFVADSLVSVRETAIAAGDGQSSSGFNIFSFIMPGSMLIGLLFISEISMRDIMRERRAGTMSRLFVSPAGPGSIIAGKILSAFTVTAAACVLLVAVGSLGFGIDWGEPVPFIVHIFAVSLMCTGLMVFFYGVIRSERLADALLSVLIVAMSLVGGSMVPYEQMGPSMQRIARFSPVFWAVDGLKQITINDAGLDGIGTHLVVLGCIAGAGILGGTILLGKSMKRGA